MVGNPINQTKIQPAWRNIQIQTTLGFPSEENFGQDSNSYLCQPLQSSITFHPNFSTLLPLSTSTKFYYLDQNIFHSQRSKKTRFKTFSIIKMIVTKFSKSTMVQRKRQIVHEISNNRFPLHQRIHIEELVNINPGSLVLFKI